MFEAEYTHVGARCTFEVLVDAFDLGADPALRAIGEIVHDIDCKDIRYGRHETPGVAAMIEASTAIPDDDARLERGAVLFGDLYRTFTARAGSTGDRPGPG
jgi:hypothetical protein